MKKRLWIATAFFVNFACTSPVGAQPVAPDAKTAADSVAIGELERAMGGRTTLELKFQDWTTEKVREAIAKSSGLPFVAPAQTPNNRLVINGPPGRVNPGMFDPALAPTWNGDVAPTDFWLALRNWGRAENVRLKREREALERLQKDDRPPIFVDQENGQPVSPELQAERQKVYSQWSRARMDQLQRVDPSATLSARLDANTDNWNLLPSNQLLSGRAVNVWPCLVLTTGFQRNQNFYIEGNSPPEIGAEKVATPVAQAEKPPNERGQEFVAGGILDDSLAMKFLVYLEPKLLKRAKVSLLLDEVRDDAGEKLLPGPEDNIRSTFSGSASLYGNSDSGIAKQIALRPRQAKGQKLATVRGVVLVKLPMQVQEHEISNFDGPQKFLINGENLPVEGQFVPPHLENGQLRFSATVALESARGGRSIINRASTNRQYLSRTGNLDRDLNEGPLGYRLLPSNYNFTDTQGRQWVPILREFGSRTRLPDGRLVPVTSPPTPLPDDFTYSEERSGTLQLVAPNPRYTGETVKLPPEQLAKVKFTKVSFTTESDWRTIEVPFEFRDLPLPPR